MTDPEFPDDVRKLLLEDIDSYEDLEALLLLARGDDRAWTAGEAAQALRVAEDLVTVAFERLHARALVAKRGPRYGPVAPDRRDTVARLARCYDERRLEVMRQMSANAIERLRNSALRGFADAFLLGRRKPDV